MQFIQYLYKILYVLVLLLERGTTADVSDGTSQPKGSDELTIHMNWKRERTSNALKPIIVACFVGKRFETHFII